MATSTPDPPLTFEGSQVVTRTWPVSDSSSPQGCGGQPKACPREGGAGWSWAGRTAHPGPPQPPPRKHELDSGPSCLGLDCAAG